MKHIINYLGALLAVVLMGTTFTACSDEDAESANVGLGIKTFFPTKVVTNQPITINGSGFDAVTEIEFPGGAKVTNFEIVSNDMIKVNAPSGIAADGGKLVVRTANDQAESKQQLTLGHTNVSGFSKQPGETAEGGELIEVYGTDLEFINSVELLNADSEIQMIDHKDFYRKGTNKLVFRVPLTDIYEGTFVGNLHTYDGQIIPMPELAYQPYSGGGHWETKETTIWDTETVFADWSATIAIGADKFADVKEGDIIRVYIKDKGSDYISIFKHVDNWADWNELQDAKEDADEYFEAPVTAEVINELKSNGLRFQGLGFTITKVTLIQNVWIEGEGGTTDIVTTIWDTETVFGDWSATIAIPADQFADVQAGDLIRVYIKDKGGDYNPIFKHVSNWSDWAEFQNGKTDGDGYFEATVPAEAVDELKSEGLRFQGIGFTITKVELTMFGRSSGGGGSSVTTIWDTETVFGDWSATIVIGTEQFANAKAGDIIRVYIKDKGSDYNAIFKHVDNWADWNEFQGNKEDTDEYFEAPIPAEALDELNTSGLRFQGIGFTIVKVELISQGGGGGTSGGSTDDQAIWSEETVFGDWSATIVISNTKFSKAKAGDVIRVYIKDKTGDYNPIFKHVDNWSDWNEFQSNKVDTDEYFEAPIPAEALEELNTSGLRFQGIGFTIVKVELIPS